MEVEKSSGHISPSMPDVVEDRVGKIWSSLLDETLEPSSNFFEAGGDSILMLNMLFEIVQAFNIEVSPDDLFQNPTLGEFSSLVVRVIDERLGESIVPKA